MNIVFDKEKLSKPCEIVSEQDGKKIGELLVSELRKIPNAVGLAANQIGIDAAVFSIKNGDVYQYFINPEILEMKNPFLAKNEGCLSLHQKYDVVRFRNIRYKDLNSEGFLEGFPAHIFQHEKNHVEGILISEIKLDLYQDCPCGSNKKFKFCHLKS